MNAILQKNKKAKSMTNAKNLEKRFDDGESVLDYFDTDSAKVIYPKNHRVNVDLPARFLKKLDSFAERIGVTRQSLIKIWLFERLQSEK